MMPVTPRIETIDADGYLRMPSGKPPGSRVRVIIEDSHESSTALTLTADERFQLGVYSAVTADDPEEDRLWEQYLPGAEGFRLGDIYIARVPVADAAYAKPRPVVIVGLLNSQGNVSVIPGNSRLPAGQESHECLVEPVDLEAGRLDQAVVFPASQMQVFPPRLLSAWVGRVSTKCLDHLLRLVVAERVGQFADWKFSPPRLIPGVTPIPPSGKLVGAPELQNMVSAALDGWLTTGRFNAEFERRLAGYLGVRRVLTTNSGSSANLLALAALTSPKLGDRALRPGDEVITVAAGFPTTVNPIVLYGLVPVFVDIRIPSYNIDPSQIEAAISTRTRAIMLAHTLGNPFDLDAVMRIARQHDLWVIEDCCDALGSTYSPSALAAPASLDRDGVVDEGRLNSGTTRKVGTFGHIGTLSFYPAHHITMGEGGAVFTQNPRLATILESLRDWGRDCFCAPGADNTCGKRFDWQLGDLPPGYDHKYTYSHLGYNFKITDLQAACGLAQMDRLESFVAARKANFAYLSERLSHLQDRLILPEATPQSDPAWFGFPITLRPTAGIRRVDLLRFLDGHKIGTRLLFAGNLARQPYMNGRNFRISGELAHTDIAMNHTFWVGVQPALNAEMLEIAASHIEAFLNSGTP